MQLSRREAIGAAIVGLFAGSADASTLPPLFISSRGRGNRTLVLAGDVFLGPYLSRLDNQFRVIGYDMRNRGRSAAVADKTQIGVLHDLADIGRVIEGSGAERVTLVAWSYMAVIAALYARDHPERVNGVVQIGPPPFSLLTRYAAEFSAPSQDVAQVGQSAPADACLVELGKIERQMLGARSAGRTIGFADRMCALPNERPDRFYPHLTTLVSSYEALALSPRDIASVRPRVLVIHGTHDRNAPLGGGLDWAYHLPNARLLRVDGAGHLVVAEASRVVSRAIASFARGAWPAGAERVRSPAVKARS